mmetsp:Transcript_28772/g.58960  ORF Transcript_28772/g.58960 Transcript_28772/m.58960 type:complete len:287 (+) Transcript_28772:1063-1923(+)
MSCIDALPAIVASVPATTAQSGTKLWNRLLKKYIPTLGASKVRLTLEIVDQCKQFQSTIENGGDTEDYFANIEQSLRELLATGDPPTMEDIIAILVIQDISKSGTMWETTATALSDIPADENRFETIKEKVRERFLTFNSGLVDAPSKGPVAHKATYPPVPGISFVEHDGETLYRIDATGQHLNDYFQAQAVMFQANAANATGGEKGGGPGGKGKRKKCDNCPRLSNHWTSECTKGKKEDGVIPHAKAVHQPGTCKRCLKPGHNSIFCKAPEPHPSVLEQMKTEKA